MTVWQYYWQRVPRTPGTVQRWHIASLALAPTPEGKAAELRLYAKQWDMTAAERLSWCVQLMKYGEKAPGRWDPWKPFNLVQVSQKDWAGFFALFGAEDTVVLDNLTAITQGVFDTGAWTRWTPPEGTLLELSLQLYKKGGT